MPVLVFCAGGGCFLGFGFLGFSFTLDCWVRGVEDGGTARRAPARCSAGPVPVGGALERPRQAEAARAAQGSPLDVCPLFFYDPRKPETEPLGACWN